MGRLKIAVIEFPGSNCDHDALFAWSDVSGQQAELIWHKDTHLKDADVVFLPGGFSYGDYLRCGAIARFSPIMSEVVKFANRGGPVIGVCNGFQILLEAGLLPGAMLRNISLRFVCKQVNLKVVNSSTLFTNAYLPGQIISVPIAHSEGNYMADRDTLQQLQDHNQIVFQYCGPDGDIDEKYNPNGSSLHIAGIMNKQGNVLGMMPHPERAVDPVLGSVDGLKLFDSIIESVVNHA